MLGNGEVGLTRQILILVIVGSNPTSPSRKWLVWECHLLDTTLFVGWVQYPQVPRGITLLATGGGRGTVHRPVHVRKTVVGAL